MKRVWKWNHYLVGQWPGIWLETASAPETDRVDFRFRGIVGGNKKCRTKRAARRLMIAAFFLSVQATLSAVPAQADTLQKHLTLDEIIVTEEAVTEAMGTAVGAKKIEKREKHQYPGCTQGRARHRHEAPVVHRRHGG